MGTVTGKYNYNVTCDVCGFVYKADQVKERWDGLIVCEKDYETRHIADFYRPRVDTHELPFTRPADSENTWTPTVTSLTQAGTGTTTVTAQYIVNGSTVDFTIEISNSATTRTTASTLNTTKLSVAHTVAAQGSGTAVDSTGKLLGTFLVVTADSTVRPPTWPATTNTIVLRGRYTK